MSLKKNYIILEQIGSGSMATVCKAIQKSLDRLVVVKQLHPHLAAEPHGVSRFEREAKAASSLKHQNIIDIIDFGEDDGQHYMVAEYIDGPSLSQILRNVNLLPKGVILSIATQVLNGLEHAHNKGIIHRDIKPSNIMFTSSGVAKITDFGIAKAADLPSLTQEGHKAIGTPSYMSPEQARGKKVDQRADLFSVGVMIFEMLTGILPFTSDSIVATLRNLIENPHPSIKELNSGVPDDLIKIIDRSLEKDVSRRFFDATEFMVALEIFAFESGVNNDPAEVEKFFKSSPTIEQDVNKNDKLSTTQIRKIHQTTGIGKEKAKIALLPLTGCFGCQMNLFDLNENFQRILNIADIQYSYFMDVKEIPEVDIGIVEGCVANSENEIRLRYMRERCRTLVAMGTCACFGGIPGLRNLHRVNDVLNRAYIQTESTSRNGHITPNSPVIPSLQAHVRPISEVVKTDFFIPGCPPPHNLLLQAIEGIINRGKFEFSSHTLCFECKRKRREILSSKREFIANDIMPLMEIEHIKPDVCFLEQGVLCMGLITRAGCDARCIRNNIPCHGCMGPVPQVRETGVNWINTLASLLPGGSMRFRHDLVGMGYCYTLPYSTIPYKK